MNAKSKVLQVMLDRAAQEEKIFGGRYPVRMATWSIRLAMEAKYPDTEWKSADLRKLLMELSVEGLVSKDAYHSRIGQAVWRLEVRDAQ